jgi:hypothetical protein
MQPSVPKAQATVEVEQVLQALAARLKTYSPTFWTRVFAVWGHATAVSIVVLDEGGRTGRRDRRQGQVGNRTA